MVARATFWLLGLVQLALGVRVVGRLIASAGGRRVERNRGPLGPGDRISIVVPVLDEAARLAPCLASLLAQGPEVAEILVVDGGSADGTRALVRSCQQREPRLRLLDAGPIPGDWNGKAWGLQVGWEAMERGSRWLLTIDADVRIDPDLARSLVHHARGQDLAALSVATLQHLSGAAEGLVHPALLTTLVYRFGIPGRVARRVDQVQANGQCCLFERAALDRLGGFAGARRSVCEDVTMARQLVVDGARVGFAESAGLAAVEMYPGWRQALAGWSRSLPMRDRFVGRTVWVGLAEVVLVQGLPLWLLALRGWLRPPRPVERLNLVLLAVRLGVLGGTARAYPDRPWTYWLSPLADGLVAGALASSLLGRRHSWRGRPVLDERGAG